MQKVLLGAVILCICFLFTTGTITNSDLTIIDSFAISQEQDGPDIYIRYDGLFVDGIVFLPEYITYTIPIEVNDSDSVTEVFADITEGHPINSYRVYANLTSGNVTDGIWTFTTSKYISWSGGIFDINFTIWACDSLGNWNSASGYRSTAMSSSYLPPAALIGSIFFLVYAVNSTRKRYIQYNESNRESTTAS